MAAWFSFRSTLEGEKLYSHLHKTSSGRQRCNSKTGRDGSWKHLELNQHRRMLFWVDHKVLFISGSFHLEGKSSSLEWKQSRRTDGNSSLHFKDAADLKSVLRNSLSYSAEENNMEQGQRWILHFHDTFHSSSAALEDESSSFEPLEFVWQVVVFSLSFLRGFYVQPADFSFKNTWSGRLNSRDAYRKPPHSTRCWVLIWKPFISLPVNNGQTFWVRLSECVFSVLDYCLKRRSGF